MDDAQGTAACLVLLGTIAQRQADYEAAIRDYELAMLSYPPLDDVYWVNMRIGISRQALGDYPGAIDAFRFSLQRGKETGPVKRGWSLLNIGDTLLLQGDPAEAGPPSRLAPLQQSRHHGRLMVGLPEPGCPPAGRSRARSAPKPPANTPARSIRHPDQETDDLHHRIDPQVPRPGTKNQGHEPFSPRELEVLQLLRSDLNGPAIAQKLVVSLNTVRYHTKNIYRKLGASTRLEALQRAKDLGPWFSSRVRVITTFCQETTTSCGDNLAAGAGGDFEEPSRITDECPTHAEAQARSLAAGAPPACARSIQLLASHGNTLGGNGAANDGLCDRPALFARRFSDWRRWALAISAMAYALASTVAAPFMGALADRFGRRRLVLVSLGAYILAFGGYLFASSALAFIALRALAGAFTAGLNPAVTGIVADLVPMDRRAQWIGVVNGGAAVG
jgi:DNA-binding CsgD family transcriptional regulator